eukprot:222594-Chlamydomonas_euryale.AAC.2
MPVLWPLARPIPDSPSCSTSSRHVRMHRRARAHTPPAPRMPTCATHASSRVLQRSAACTPKRWRCAT